MEIFTQISLSRTWNLDQFIEELCLFLAAFNVEFHLWSFIWNDDIQDLNKSNHQSTQPNPSN